MKKNKVKKPHPIRHGFGMFFATLLLLVAVVLNYAYASMGMVVESFVGAATPKVDDAARQQTEEEAKELAKTVAAEGMVLLQNNDGTLPFSDSVKKVNVFGWASTAWLAGGSGSGGVSRMDVDLLSALESYGIAYNTALTDMYRNFQDGREYTSTLNSWPEQSARLYEPSIDNRTYYSETMLADALEFSDTALVVIGRLAGESNDATNCQYKRIEKEGEIVTDETRMHLELSAEEEALLAYVGANYEHVVVLLNSTNVMELGQVETIPGVDACMQVGLPGQVGTAALPEVLWGERQPGGRTADTWAYDMTTAPSYVNAGLEGVGAYTGVEGLYPADGTTNGNLGEPYAYEQVSYTDYAEGIYIGYKWYETADAEGFWSDVANEHGMGYEGVVQYPFGYGLSYTDFTWKVTEAPENESVLTKDGKVTVKVEVTNTGDMPGQEVVQLYYAAPYIPGGIEKSAAELAAFGKTKTLAPGESEELALEFDVEEMASYDCYDANGNGFAGYELDAGDYVFTVRSDAHTPRADAITMRLPETVKYETDKVSGAAVGNKFTGADAIDGISLDGADSEQDIVYLSRSDFAATYPVRPESRAMDGAVAALNLYDEAQAQAYIDESDEPIVTGAKNGLKIEEKGVTTELGYALGADYDDPRWEELLDQLTVKEMENMYVFGYGGIVDIKSIGKVRTKDADGPAQIGGFTGMGAGCGFPGSSTLAQTWNIELARQEGRTIGHQAILNGYSGWYAPAVNIHRSPLNGRNYEYYSEDSILSGAMCGNTVQGANEAGVYTYVKHFICNDGEAGIYRDSVYLWMTEQTLREIYLKPFQMLVEDYDAVGLMTSYNRIGAVWAGGSEALLTGVLRDEWGFTGGVITDYCDHHAFMNGDQALRAGGSLWMSGFMGGTLAQETSSNSYYQALRAAAKNTLYMYLHVRVTNRDYCEAVGDDTLLRPVFAAPTFGIRQLIYAVTAVAVLLFALAIRALVIDHKLRKQAKQQG